MTAINQLYDLLELDKEIEQCRKSIKEIDDALEDKALLFQSEQSLNKATSILKSQEAARVDLELTIESTTTKGNGIEKKMYSGAVTNPRELEDMQKELQIVRSQESKLEENLLNVLQSLEKTRPAVTKLTAHVDNIRTNRENQESRLVNERATLNKSSTKLVEQRGNLSSLINPQYLTLYQSIRVPNPLVKIEKGMCQGCRIALPTNLIKTARISVNPTQCPSCTRILYAN